MTEHTVDREYKNNVFCDLFSEKSNALSLYNALNHTDYQNTEEVEIVTLSDVIYMQQKNDVSIMFQNELVLWEHQSTLNFNMPLRGLIYFAHNIDGVLKSKGITLYGKNIDRCIQENHLKSYLLKKKAEVSLMLLTEFNQEAFVRVIRNEGIEEGIEQGEGRVNQLNSYLISDKRFDDLTRATKDKQYQALLYKEYGL